MRFFNRLKIQRVIIYGLHSEDWNTALGPNSKVWQLLPNVGQVLVVDAIPGFLPSKKIYYKDCIIPLMEKHIIDTPNSSSTLKPQKEVLNIFANKKSFSKLLNELSLSQFQPKVYSELSKIKFPVVLKRTDLNASQGIKIIFSNEELIKSLSEDMWREEEFIIQEFVKNNCDYVWHAVYKNGIRLWEITFIYTKQNSLVLRDSCTEVECTKIDSDSEALNIFDQILFKMNFSGPCNIDFSYISSDLKIFEINPRFGGSLMKKDNAQYLAQALNAIIRSTL